MDNKVCKFGGTSLANLSQVDKAIGIIRSDTYRRFIIPSAPGERYRGDPKVTALLLKSAKEYSASGTSESAGKVVERLREICKDSPELTRELEAELEKRLKNTKLAQENPDRYTEAIAAFGEYSMGRLLVDRMNKQGLTALFLDPKDIGFRAAKVGKHFQPDPSSYADISKALAPHLEGKSLVIIPGFYAYNSSGELVTLPRGGSDTSGAVVANAVNASTYENWTDEPGLRRADPRVVPTAKTIEEITYEEARELAQRGFKLQEDSMLPLFEKRVPMNVRDTNHPEASGTLVLSDRLVRDHERIVGVAAKQGYIAINISKMGMNNILGFGADVFRTLADNKVSYEHSPTGRDRMSIIIEQDQLQETGKLNTVLRALDSKLGPLGIEITEPMALVAVVGLGMKRHPEIAGRVLTAIGKYGMMPRAVNIGASPISGFIGVDERRAEEAVKAIHDEFFAE